MVNVEPFIFQKVTAFKERLQMVDKINEIIETVNSMDIDPEQIQAMIEKALADYYTKEEVDELLANIDFSPYYTKTEVNAIVSRIDGDVDAVEGRLDTAEGDIDALEINKQDVMSGGDGIVIDNNEVSLKGWKMVPLDEWANLLEVDATSSYIYDVKEDFVIVVRIDSVNEGSIGPTQYACRSFFKGMKITSVAFYVQIPLQIHDAFGWSNNPVRNSVGVLQVSPGFTTSATKTTQRYYYMGLSKGSESNDNFYNINLPDYIDLQYKATKYYSEDNNFPLGQTGTLVSVLRRES